jgi:hypothetical protein
MSDAQRRARINQSSASSSRSVCSQSRRRGAPAASGVARQFGVVMIVSF